MSTNRGPAEPVIFFPETDYRFGIGPLRMRVERIDWNQPVRYDNDDWYEVDGIEMTADGREVGRRQALVRAASLSAARKNSRLH